MIWSDLNLTFGGLLHCISNRMRSDFVILYSSSGSMSDSLGRSLPRVLVRRIHQHPVNHVAPEACRGIWPEMVSSSSDREVQFVVSSA